MENETSSIGLMQSLKEGFAAFFNKLTSSPNSIIEIIVALAIGYMFGFLLKRYSNYVFAFAAFIIALIILQQFEFIIFSLNMAKLEALWGIQQVPMTSDVFSLAWAWILMNATITISFTIGTILGLKLA